MNHFSTECVACLGEAPRARPGSARDRPLHQLRPAPGHRPALPCLGRSDHPAGALEHLMPAPLLLECPVVNARWSAVPAWVLLRGLPQQLPAWLVRREVSGCWDPPCWAALQEDWTHQLLGGWWAEDASSKGIRPTACRLGMLMGCQGSPKDIGRVPRMASMAAACSASASSSSSGSGSGSGSTKWSLQNRVTA